MYAHEEVGMEHGGAGGGEALRFGLGRTCEQARCAGYTLLRTSWCAGCFVFRDTNKALSGAATLLLVQCAWGV